MNRVLLWELREVFKATKTRVEIDKLFFRTENWVGGDYWAARRPEPTFLTKVEANKELKEERIDGLLDASKLGLYRKAKITNTAKIVGSTPASYLRNEAGQKTLVNSYFLTLFYDRNTGKDFWTRNDIGVVVVTHRDDHKERLTNKEEIWGYIMPIREE